MHDITADRQPVSGRARGDSEICLTPRETECLLRLAQGYRSEAIAYDLGVKRVTVDLHIANAKRKLGALTREHAVALSMHMHLIKPDLD